MSSDDNIQNFRGQKLAGAILRTQAQISPAHQKFQSLRMNLKAKSNAIVSVSLTITSSRQKAGCCNLIDGAAGGELFSCAMVAAKYPLKK
jgi:hypothetical protein